MSDYDTIRKGAFRYWERRRIVYNIVLVPPSFISYLLGAGLNRAGDSYNWHSGFVVFLFLLSAIGANICYSFVYALEFLFACDDISSRWRRFGRKTAFIGGMILSIVLALIGGQNIALMEFYQK